MRHSHLALFTGALLVFLLSASAGAQRTAGATTVQRPGEQPPGAAASRAPAARPPGQIRPRREAAVTVVLVSSLPQQNATAVIMRRASRQPQNVILVTQATTAADLARALTALDESRRTRGDQISRDMLARVAAAPASPGGDSAQASRARRSPRPRVLADAKRVLASLRRAPATYVEGVGSHPARVIALDAASR